ncbi:hypothetical protein GUITHDRAFT_134508 [Guillardia theta CCMP2712]|uniref:Uncharacterized protein n=1 Tax=Guillardia theta (strain CCMP2712) TaxID=905079 RepID=L1JU47_GUITC|nr:hypothetical protein GUITHDRAFT_134508 [Guillardia theta CCMP2712]EKX51613.1 hypothetical protein GUITHDRAFT_134508 [Guillardia theta CCMP2712]|eukprot:XP_005838593.1 hypothetical protein GUITHDRAFT_134508 [Guillardia theta CCMP2712]
MAENHNNQDLYELLLPGTRQRHLNMVHENDVLESALEEVRNWKKGKRLPTESMQSRRQSSLYESRPVNSRREESFKFEEKPQTDSRSRILTRLDELLKEDKERKNSRTRTKDSKEDAREDKFVRISQDQPLKEPKKDKDSIWEAVYKAEKCFETDDVIKGIDYLMDAVAANPDEPRIVILLAQKFASKLPFVDLSLFGKALVLVKNLRKRGVTSKQKAEVCIVFGKCYEEFGRKDLALASFAEAIQLQPAAHDPLHSTAVFLHARCLQGEQKSSV